LDLSSSIADPTASSCPASPVTEIGSGAGAAMVGTVSDCGLESVAVGTSGAVPWAVAVLVTCPSDIVQCLIAGAEAFASLIASTDFNPVEER
jgi:hypothetical protein